MVAKKTVADETGNCTSCGAEPVFVVDGVCQKCGDRDQPTTTDTGSNFTWDKD